MGYGFEPDNNPIRTHVHTYGTRTSFDVGHSHGLSGTTSPTINPGPQHVHVMEGSTTLDNGHTHRYKTTTGPAIPTRPGFHVHRYYGIASVAGRLPHTHRFNGVTSQAPDDF